MVIKGVITDAAFFEMKNKTNKIDKEQIEGYIDLSRKLKVNKLITISNEFVSDPSHSPVKLKSTKYFSLLHFSWTYLITKGQLLLIDNEENISSPDQEEIMQEALHYFENPLSGIRGYTQMKPGWKELSENVRAQNILKPNDVIIEEAVQSWYEEEKDIALLVSRSLGVLVKSTTRNSDSQKKDMKRLAEHNYISGNLSIKGAASDIKITAEFERRTLLMSIKITPPLDKGPKARITWICKQLENLKRKSEEAFVSIENDIWIEADIKYAKDHIKVKISELDNLATLSQGKEIQAFHIVYIKSLGANFSSTKKFIVIIEDMILDYYEAIVQFATTWTRPTPKLNQEQ